MIKYLTFFLLLLSSLCFSQEIDETNTSYINQQFETEINEAKKLVTELISKKSIPGLSITAAKRDKILWAEGFGFSDLENQIPVKLNSKFRIGSISKSLTTVAMAKLIEDGKISLNDTVQKFVPYFPNKKYPITIYELATHTAGIRHYKDEEFFSNKFYESVEESVGVFREDPLLFEPKTTYSYSTYGYTLLSAVIEGSTKQKYLDYMYNYLFKPMGMYNTVPDLNNKNIDNRVRFYELKGSAIAKAAYVDNSNKWAGGGFLSTSLDLAKMSQGLLKNEYLKESTLKMLWTPNTLSNGKTTNYCLGWRKNKDDLGRSYAHHGGSSIGGRSFLLIYPEEEVIVAITCNIYTVFNQSFAMKIAEKFIK